MITGSPPCRGSERGGFTCFGFLMFDDDVFGGLGSFLKGLGVLSGYFQGYFQGGGYHRRRGKFCLEVEWPARPVPRGEGITLVTSLSNSHQNVSNYLCLEALTLSIRLWYTCLCSERTFCFPLPTSRCAPLLQEAPPFVIKRRLSISIFKSICQGYF